MKCPECGATRFAREDTIVKGSRMVLAHMDDEAIHFEDDSLDWEVEDSQFGWWMCWPNEHPMTNEMHTQLEEASENA